MSTSTAVVRIQDVQYRVSENDLLRVPRLAEEVGAKVEFEDVLFLGGDDVKIGTPTVEGARVVAEVVEHGRDEKIVVFKMKRRKNYRRRHGHRQPYTQIRIKSIEG
jgi:large subunit ribosomal protein L21